MPQNGVLTVKKIESYIIISYHIFGHSYTAANKEAYVAVQEYQLRKGSEDTTRKEGWGRGGGGRGKGGKQEGGAEGAMHNVECEWKVGGSGNEDGKKGDIWLSSTSPPLSPCTIRSARQRPGRCPSAVPLGSS